MNDNDEPQGNSPITWLMVAIVVLALLGLFGLCTAGAAHAQERSPAPNTEDVVALVWRCDSMVVQVENQGDTDMQRTGYFLWAGEQSYQELPIIDAGYSRFFNHPTARTFFMITYGDGTTPPHTQEVSCEPRLFLPLVQRRQP